MKIDVRVLLPILVAVLLLGGLLFAWSGAFNPAADEPHWNVTYKVLDYVRVRGVVTRTDDIVVPDLEDPALIRSGAGNYAAMCVDCHLAPGLPEGEIQRGMYPTPPNLSAIDGLDPARTFWTIKHGVKMSGMPAWGKSMNNATIWGMTAFVRRLPGMTPEEYGALVASSGGHDHGGGAGAGQPVDEMGHAGMEGMDHGTGDEAGHAGMDGMDHGTGGEVGHAHGAAGGAAGGDMAGMDHGDKPATKSGNMAGMDHGDMPGMDHGSKTAAKSGDMAGMDHEAMAGMEHGAQATGKPDDMGKMDHSDMADMKSGAMTGMDHGDMPGMKSGAMAGMEHGAMKGTEPVPPRRISGPAEAALQAFQDALQVGNLGLALGRLHPDLVVSEGGHVESSRDAYADGHMKADMALLKNAKVQLLSREVEAGNEHTVIVSESRITGSGADGAIDIVSTERATLRETSEGWKIVRLEWHSRPAGENTAE